MTMRSLFRKSIASAAETSPVFSDTKKIVGEWKRWISAMLSKTGGCRILTAGGVGQLGAVVLFLTFWAQHVNDLWKQSAGYADRVAELEGAYGDIVLVLTSSDDYDAMSSLKRSLAITGGDAACKKSKVASA
jgi:hypothetical protein